MIYHEDPMTGYKTKTFRDGIIKVVGVCGKLGSHKLYEYTCSICSPDTDLFYKPLCGIKNKILSGSFSCGCSLRPKWDERQTKIRLSRVCNLKQLEILDYQEFKGNKTKVSFGCLVCGKEFTLDIGNSLKLNSGCRYCGFESQRSKMKLKNPEEILIDICSSNNITFKGFVSSYKNCYSIFKYECPNCKEVRQISYKKFVYDDVRCSSCSKSGYSKSKTGFYYISKYRGFDVDIIKHGITNCVDSRMKDHDLGTKLSRYYTLVYKFIAGEIPPIIENKILKSFKNGVVDKTIFNNYTETIDSSSYDDVLSLVDDYLNKIGCVYERYVF